MSDRIDHAGLYRTAESQSGFFTAKQAVDAGMDRSTLHHHARPGGRYEHVRRGLYRLRQFPTTAHEHVVGAWISIPPPAIVSHESALELHGLSDALPDVVHVTIPRAKRGYRPRPGIRVHTPAEAPAANAVRYVEGVPVTSPERTIVDVLAAGGQPEQVELAIRQALARDLTTPDRLRAAAAGSSHSVRRFIERELSGPL